jgi:glycosyltransferase involved in cell wall biosynthesis
LISLTNNSFGGTPLPKVTIAIPTLNRVAYLRLAVESARRQTYSNIEIIVSNNSSNDATADYLSLVRDPRLLVLQQDVVLSMVDNWNACLSAASGEYFLLLSDDDLLEPTAIDELVAGYLQGSDELQQPGIVYCSGDVIDSNGKVLWATASAPIQESAQDLILGLFRGKRDVLLCSILFRKSDMAPGFPLGFDLVNDAAMWMSILVRYGYSIHVAKSLIKYRIHQNNLSNSTPAEVWIAEATTLADLVLTNSKLTGKPIEVFAAELSVALREYSLRTLSRWINQSLGKNKWAALLEYRRKFPLFLSAYGVRALVKGLLSLFLPRETKDKLKKMRTPIQKLKTRPGCS